MEYGTSIQETFWGSRRTQAKAELRGSGAEHLQPGGHSFVSL